MSRSSTEPKQRANKRQRKEFMMMALAAFDSKTAKHSRSKTLFISRLLERDVDRATIARFNKALDANPQKTG